MASTGVPPFPEDIHTMPLVVIDFLKIKDWDEDEINKLWEASMKLGFWYMGADAMALPMEEKMKYEQGDGGVSAGYKAAGANAVNATGQRDLAEFFNLSKDDVLKWPAPGNREYPKPITDAMATVVQPFVRKCIDINNTFFEVFNERLGLPSGTLLERHLDTEASGSEARITRTPPTSDPNRISIGGHTDFGSLTILFNRLGGLQVLPPGREEAQDWQYVKPLAGHAICNIGDGLNILSGRILRSNMHRVLPPPGSQAYQERWSLAFFTRPGDSTLLRPLTEESQVINEAVKERKVKNPNAAAEAYLNQTQGEWFTRRIKNQRINNRKGPETWNQSRGTEIGAAV